MTDLDYTEEEKAAIELQLERLVADGHFSHSRRFPPFLRIVVMETLSGNMGQLKERTIGVEIFGKEPDYDTATEPIVRVTAAEIRKRIAQYYQDPGHQRELRVSLPPGTYVPQFEFPAEHIEQIPRTISAPAESLALSTPAQEPPRMRRGFKWMAWAFAAVAASSLATLVVYHRDRPAPIGPVTGFWKPITSSSDPVLVCVADQTQYDTLILRDAADPSHLVRLHDQLTAVVIDDLNIIAKITGVLQASGKPYKLRGEAATTLSDLRNGPSVIVGAFDNA